MSFVLKLNQFIKGIIKFIGIQEILNQKNVLTKVFLHKQKKKSSKSLIKQMQKGFWTQKPVLHVRFTDSGIQK